MTYEIAKMLKDNGFPQKRHPELERDDNRNVWFEADNGGEYFRPLLSELIEAIPEMYFGLEKHSNDWRCGTLRRGGMDVMVSGSTPEEAVSRLWLELNKKR